MTICASAQCGRTEDGFRAFVQEALPPGKLYSIDDPERCFSKFWLAIADVFKELEDCLCCLYANAIPCQPGYNAECDVPALAPTCLPQGYERPLTLLERHALLYNFPDCVDLTHDALCEWVSGPDDDCAVGSIVWLQWLLDFAGISGTLEYDPGGVSWGCMELGKDPICAVGPRIIVSDCDLETQPAKSWGGMVWCDPFCCPSDPACPKIEALRPKYFPVGVEIVYS